MITGRTGEGKRLYAAGEIYAVGRGDAVGNGDRGNRVIGTLETERVGAGAVTDVVTGEDGIRAGGIERTDGINPRTERAVGAELGPVGPIDPEQRVQLAGRGGHAHQNMLAGLAAKDKAIQLAAKVDRPGDRLSIADWRRGRGTVGALEAERVDTGAIAGIVTGEDGIGAGGIERTDDIDP